LIVIKNKRKETITPAIKYPKAVIPAKAGIQENTLDAGSSPACQNPGIILLG
jgi:hypothetical protein